MMLKAHNFPIRIYFEDTDAGGVVYHANYLRFMERARTEMLRDAGIDHAQLIKNDDLMFVVKSCAIEYHAPARLDDALTVETSVAAWGNASLTLSQNIKKDGAPISSSTVVLVCVNTALKPCRIPATIRDRL